LAPTGGRWRPQRAARANLLAPPPHRRHAEAGKLRDLPRALALLVKFDDALAEGNTYGLHVPILPQAFPFCKLHYLWKCSSPVDLQSSQRHQGAVLLAGRTDRPLSAAAGASGGADEPLPLQAAPALLRPPGSHRPRAESLDRLRPAHASDRLHLNPEHRPNLIPLSTCVSPPRTAARFPPWPLPSSTLAPSRTDQIPFPRSRPLLGANNICHPQPARLVTHRKSRQRHRCDSYVRIWGPGFVDNTRHIWRRGGR